MLMRTIRKKFRDGEDIPSPYMLSMIMLGFGSGLPYLLLGSTLALRLSEDSIPLAMIGMSAWFALPYSLKPIWAGLVESNDPPLLLKTLGRYRGWLFLSQILVGAGLMLIATCDYKSSFIYLSVICFITALCAANQDMFVDAIRINISNSDWGAGIYLSLYQFGYRAGILFSGSTVLIISQKIGWSYSYLIASGFMIVPMAGTIICRFVDPSISPIFEIRHNGNIMSAIRSMWNDRWSLPMLCGVSLFRFPDLIAEPMKNPFLHTFGGSAMEIGVVQGLIGLPAGVVGIVLGGAIVSNLGLRRGIIVATIIQIVQMCSFVVLLHTHKVYYAMSFIIFMDNMSSAITGTVLVYALSMFVDKKTAVCDFSVLTSIYALSAKILRGFSGLLIAHISHAVGIKLAYEFFFLSIGAFGIVGCYLINRHILIIKLYKSGVQDPLM